jgi:hypothetical protein
LAFVISPQPWAGLQVSKHHYARALAARDWRVVFIDPPAELGKPGRIEQTATEVSGIFRLRYQTFFPYRLKFHARPLFDLLMWRQAKRLVQAAGRPNLVWDFDNAYQFRDLRPFRAAKTIFHLVDDVGRPGMGDKHADHFFALHPVFCLNAGRTCREDHVIGHGLAKMYVEAARNLSSSQTDPERPHIALVANLAAKWIDWESIAEMVRRHPEGRFTFWGPLPEDNRQPEALKKVLAAANAVFPGLTSPEAIVAQSGDVDVWLLPFLSEEFDRGRPLNSHKVLEFLSTGKSVLMSWLEAYEGNPLVHVAERPESRDLPDRLDRLLAELETVNAPRQQEARRTYALARSYENHLDRILSLIGHHETTAMKGHKPRAA